MTKCLGFFLFLFVKLNIVISEFPQTTLVGFVSICRTQKLFSFFDLLSYKPQMFVGVGEDAKRSMKYFITAEHSGKVDLA